ncbi:hypothetical protein K9O30_02810 [Clostridium bowmanii]|uniref:hypothetical protein n=1 Tax=Clostridium bowmanii TaxID=132925 RepID=UPI001C0B6882|nr:hypothetical protein [Clostridium bowmanii]MBU3188299.1 hypothetical protein [Clostridium bowmanii]MCA1072687.1 hypothetical protein [Clostridium bowmanii]
MKKSFIFKLIASILFVFTAYLPNNSIIKIVALIVWLIAVFLESIKKLWSKYKTK